MGCGSSKATAVVAGTRRLGDGQDDDVSIHTLTLAAAPQDLAATWRRGQQATATADDDPDTDTEQGDDHESINTLTIDTQAVQHAEQGETSTTSKDAKQRRGQQAEVNGQPPGRRDSRKPQRRGSVPAAIDTGGLLKVLVVGDRGIGKTRLCRLLSNKPDDDVPDPSVGVDFSFVRVPVTGKATKGLADVQLWDVSPEWRQCPFRLERCDAAIVVIEAPVWLSLASHGEDTDRTQAGSSPACATNEIEHDDVDAREPVLKWLNCLHENVRPSPESVPVLLMVTKVDDSCLSEPDLSRCPSLGSIEPAPAWLKSTVPPVLAITYVSVFQPACVSPPFVALLRHTLGLEPLSTA